MLSRRRFLANSLFITGSVLLSAVALSAIERSATGSVNVLAGPMLYVNNDLIPVSQIVSVQQMASAAPAPSSSTVRSAAAVLHAGATNVAGQIQLQTNWLVSKTLADWINAAAAHAPTASSGSLLVISNDLKVQSSYTWNGGVISQFVLPACDATVPAYAVPTLTFQASSMVTNLAASPQPAVSRRLALQRWQSDHFQLTSNVLTPNVNLHLERTAQVGNIVLSPAARGGSVSIVLQYETDKSGEMQPWADAVGHPGGQPLPGQSTDITLRYLAPDLHTPIGSVVLHDCRVLKLATQVVNTRVSRLIVTVSYADATLGLTAV